MSIHSLVPFRPACTMSEFSKKSTKEEERMRSQLARGRAFLPTARRLDGSVSSMTLFSSVCSHPSHSFSWSERRWFADASRSKDDDEEVEEEETATKTKSGEVNTSAPRKVISDKVDPKWQSYHQVLCVLFLIAFYVSPANSLHRNNFMANLLHKQKLGYKWFTPPVAERERFPWVDEEKV